MGIYDSRPLKFSNGTDGAYINIHVESRGTLNIQTTVDDREIKDKTGQVDFFIFFFFFFRSR